MKLKKAIQILLFALVTSSVMPAFAGEPTPGTTTEKTSGEANSQQALNRIIEIRNMDRSNMTSSEKRELRKELRHLKKEPKRKNGIYLSVGALIVIGVLLILLL